MELVLNIDLHGRPCMMLERVYRRARIKDVGGPHQDQLGLVYILLGITNGHDGVRNEYDGRSELGFIHSIAADAADSLVERHNHIEKK
jgi:hypothetical protein